MALSLAQYLAEAPQRDREDGSLEKCNVCGVALQEAIQGYRRVGDCAECSDCYFDEISAMIDQRPLGRPMSRVSGS